MGCFTRSGVFLALCLLSIAVSGTQSKAIRSAANRHSPEASEGYDRKEEGPVSFKEQSAHREQYQHVLNELEKHPKYLAARERNDREAEERRARMGRWMREHRGHTDLRALDRPSEKTKAKYEEVLEELQSDPRYLRARERNDSEAEERRARMGRWMREHRGDTDLRALDRPSEKTKAKYEEVLKELQSDPRYIRARERNGRQAEQRTAQLGERISGKPTTTGKRPHEGGNQGWMLEELQGSKKFKEAKGSQDGEEAPPSYLEQQPKLHALPKEDQSEEQANQGFRDLSHRHLVHGHVERKAVPDAFSPSIESIEPASVLLLRGGGPSEGVRRRGAKAVADALGPLPTARRAQARQGLF